MQDVPPEFDGRVDGESRFMGAGACVVARKRGHDDGENDDEDEEEEDDRRRKTTTTILPPPSPPKKRDSPKKGKRQAGTVLDRPDIEGEWWSVTPEK